MKLDPCTTIEDRPGSRAEPAPAREDGPAGRRWEGRNGLRSVINNVEVRTLAGLQRDLVFFVIARPIPLRVLPSPGSLRSSYGQRAMEQMARNVLKTRSMAMLVDRARSLMHDRDPLSTIGSLARS